MEGEDLREFALAQLDRVQGFHPRVEGKASFLLALDLGMLALLAVNVSLRPLATPQVALGLFILFLLGMSLTNIVATYFPHLANPVRPSMLYFGDIARQDAEAYMARVRGATSDDVVDDALCQVWRNAEILKLKFERMERAFKATFTAVPFWVLALILAATQSGKLAMGG